MKPKLFIVLVSLLLITNAFSQVVGSGQVTWHGNFLCESAHSSPITGLGGKIAWEGPYLTSCTIGYSFTSSGKRLTLSTKIIDCFFDNQVHCKVNDDGVYPFKSFTDQTPKLLGKNLNAKCEIYYNGTVVDSNVFKEFTLGPSNRHMRSCDALLDGSQEQQMCINNFKGTWEIRNISNIYVNGPDNNTISNFNEIYNDFDRFIVQKKGKEQAEKTKQADNKRNVVTPSNNSNTNNQMPTNPNQSTKSTSAAPSNYAPRQTAPTINRISGQTNEQRELARIQQENERVTQQNERIKQENERIKQENEAKRQQAKRNYEMNQQESKRIEEFGTYATNTLTDAINDAFGNRANGQAMRDRQDEEDRQREEEKRIHEEESRAREEKRLEENRIANEKVRVEAEWAEKRNNYYNNSIPGFKLPNKYKDAGLAEVYFFYITRPDDRNVAFSSLFPLRKLADNSWPYKSDIDNKLKAATKAPAYKLVGFFTDINVASARQQQLIQAAQEEGYEVNSFNYQYKDYKDPSRDNPPPKKKTSDDFWNR